jgi:hypothetical protein
VPQGNAVLNGVEAAQARDPTEAIRAMEAELEERRRIEAMLKVRFLGVIFKLGFNAIFKVEYLI